MKLPLLNKNKSATEREITVRLEPAEIKRMEQRVRSELAKYRRNAKLDGFRRGKVPEQILRRRYGDALRQDAMHEAIDRTLPGALREHGLVPVARPAIVEIKDGDGQLQYRVRLDVAPEIRLKKLSKISLERIEAQVQDADLERVIERLRLQRAEWRPVERAARPGDRVHLHRADDQSAQVQQVLLDDEVGEPSLVALLTGATAGQRLSWKPEGGEAVELVVDLVDEVHSRPPLDADFCRAMGQQDGDLAALRNTLRQQMGAGLQARLQEHSRQRVQEALMDAHDFELPGSMVAEETAMMRHQLQEQNKALKDAKIPDELLLPQARRSVKWQLLARAMVAQQGLAIDDAALNAAIEEEAGQGRDSAAVRRAYSKNQGARNALRARLLEQSLYDLVLEQAQVRVRTLDYKEAQNALAGQ